MSIKIPMSFFTEAEKSIHKFIQKIKRSQIAKSILRKKRKSKGITMPGFILYFRAIVTKTSWYWHKNRREDKEIQAHCYCHLIFVIQWRKNSLFNNGAGKTGYLQAED
jgi:hypothetical protein